MARWRGPGGGVPGGSELLDDLLVGRRTETVTAVHPARDPGAVAVPVPGRLAAGARRANGGAILIDVDATDLLALRRQSSLDRLLEEIASTTDAVAYVAFEAVGAGHTCGPAPPRPGPRAIP